MIASQGNPPWPLDCSITDLKSAGLPAPSLVRFKLFTLDHRLVRDGHIDGRSHAALALYLFLVTVGDSRGLSYWSQNAVARRRRLNLTALTAARGELAAAGLVAYEEPMWQVLELPGGAA